MFENSYWCIWFVRVHSSLSNSIDNTSSFEYWKEIFQDDSQGPAKGNIQKIFQIPLKHCRTPI